MGETPATSQASGKELVVMKLLRMCVRDEAEILALSLRYFRNLIGAG